MKNFKFFLLTALYLIISISSYSQTISGLVTDNNNDPIVGVNVKVKGSTISTLTNDKGEYTIKVPEGKQALVFSYKDKAKIIEINSRSIVNAVIDEKKDKNFAKNPRKQNPLGLNLTLGGPSYSASLSADYFVSPSFNIEAGGGLIGFYGGIKYHIGGNKSKNWTPYLGLYINGIPQINLFSSSSGDFQIGTYVPLGMQYMSSGGFTFAIEAAGGYTNDNFIPWGALKFGYHF